MYPSSEIEFHDVAIQKHWIDGSTYPGNSPL
jgi:hypothetical protein